MQDLGVQKASLEVGDLGHRTDDLSGHEVNATRERWQLNRPGDPDQRSPGSLAGYIVTGTDWSRAVRMMRFCSSACAAG